MANKEITTYAQNKILRAEEHLNAAMKSLVRHRVKGSEAELKNAATVLATLLSVLAKAGYTDEGFMKLARE